ncbi:MAG: hypothetical protein EXR75_09245 [Myxococcales bacterium]|nr:hypothetical protein [Myxococcales bacterium]
MQTRTVTLGGLGACGLRASRHGVRGLVPRVLVQRVLVQRVLVQRGRGVGSLAVAALLVACAAGSDKSSGATSGVAWSTSSSGGSTASMGSASGGANGGANAGGAGGGAGETGSGGLASAGGAGGAGGGANAGGAGGGANAGGAGGAGGGSGGGAEVLVFGGGATSLFGGELKGGAWSSKTIAGGTQHVVGLAFRNDGIAAGVYRDDPTGALTFLTHDALGWSNPQAIAVGVTTQRGPAVFGGVAVDAIFHGDDFKHYFASYGAGWSPIAEPVTPPNSAQSFGPTQASITGIKGDAVIAFTGDDAGVYVQERALGVWKPAVMVPGSSAALGPTVASTGAASELVLVYLRASDHQPMYSLRTMGSWSAPLSVEAKSYSDATPALLGRTDGTALLVFRGLDQKGYATTMTPGKKPPWSPPQPIATPNDALSSTPALALGVGANSAEMAFVKLSDGKIYYSALAGSVWQVPVLVGGTSLSFVAIASAP